MHAPFFKIVMEGQYGIGLLVNAMLYVPQILRLVKERASNELSYVMFCGFLCLTLSQVLYGFFRHDWIMAWGNMSTFITCGTVVCLIFIYRKK
jgi:MtN3 and saliva related transmembrane protein